MKNKGMQQLHTLSRSSEAIDVLKITRQSPSRLLLMIAMITPFRTPVFFLLQWEAQTIIKLKLKQASKEF